jgi:hypothetical protein
MANFRSRTVTFLATLTALILVLAFGNSSYHDWVVKHAAGSTVGDQFLQALSWPHWEFTTNASIRDLLASDLRAIFVIVFTWVFVMLIGSGPWSGVRGAIGHFLHGWASYIFAGAFAGLLATFIGTSASFAGSLSNAIAGAAYGLLVGWIVGLVTLASE